MPRYLPIEYVEIISGTGHLAIERGEDIPLENRDLGATDQARIMQRNHLKMHLGRGHKLKDKLVRELGFGVLFSPRIW